LGSSRIGARASATSVIALCAGLAIVPIASADPADPAVPAPPPGGDEAPVPTDAAATACSQFAAALDHAAMNYGDFANSIAGDQWSYDDPIVSSNNVIGRTALRDATVVALQASATPGLQPDIATPMQSWSLNASKLLVLMGVRAPTDNINAKATDMNNDTYNAQMACAAAGTHA
jgi:hypothetical protein